MAVIDYYTLVHSIWDGDVVADLQAQPYAMGGIKIVI